MTMTGTQLRIHAEDLMRAEDDDALLALVSQLREDEYWTRMWAPGCALAASRLGRAEEARQYLYAALDGGFFQPELFEGEIEKAFAGEPDWPRIQARFAANVPPAPLELIAWPALTPALPLQLYRMAPEREQLLGPLLPDLSGSSWQRALTLLHWVASRWTHANDHVEEVQDAVDVLHHVDADGMRFACVEYSIVLCHALNAAGIPSRRLALRQRNYHAGWGKGHVVSEAWIDDLGMWVVLDGQNGGYWTFDSRPLSTLELQAALADGRCPTLLTAQGPAKPATTAWWFSYFHHISTTGATWAQPPFIPHFQSQLHPGPPLVRTAEDVYPDLAEVGVNVDVRDGAAALRFTSRHPFLSGYAIQHGDQRWTVDAADPVWVLPTTAGAYTATVAVRTELGELTPQQLTFRVTGGS